MKIRPASTQSSNHRDLVAAALSGVAPGLGQWFKGHFLVSAGILAIDLVLFMWVVTLFCLSYAAGSLLAALGLMQRADEFLLNAITILLGLVPALVFWILVALDAYEEADKSQR